MRFCIGRNAASLRAMKRILLLAAVFLPLIAAAIVLVRTPSTVPSAMEAKYTNNRSAFAENEEGLRIHYRDEGNPDGYPLVLLHGNSSSLHTWEPLVDRLGGEFRIITYDHPGHGLSSQHPDDKYNFDGMADALDLIVETLELEEFALGGNSMGGWISWRYALEHQDQVTALILLDAAGAPLREGESEPPLNAGFRLAGSPIGRFAMRHMLPRRIIAKSMRQSVTNQDVASEEAIDRHWELLRIPSNRRAAGFRFRAGREPEMFERIGELKMPTLILWGADDQLIYASAAQTFADRIEGSTVRIYENVGHIPMEEAPDLVASDVRRFLERFAPDVEDQLALEPNR